jgi:hypothetical protein
MGLLDVLVSPAGLSTFAPCADLKHILLNPALRHEIFPIITPLLWEKWQDALTMAGLLDNLNDVPRGLCFCFCIGVCDALSATFTPPNHPSSAKHSSIIEQYFSDEESAGHVSPHYSQVVLKSLIGFFRTTPLGVLFRTPTAKPHMIQDHSFSRAHDSIMSVNSQIDSSAFVCDWYPFLDCYRLVALAPKYCEAAVFDVDAAFRRIPVALEDWLFLYILHEDGGVHIDHVACFSYASCPSIFGHVADAIVAIYRDRVKDILKWVDDFVFFHYASLCRRCPMVSMPT